MTVTMTYNNPQWQEAVDAIHSAQTILVVSHVSPDGDAIGSLLGMTTALQQIGKTVTGALDDSVPAYLAFTPNSGSIVNTLSGDFDLMISVDSSDEERTGKIGEYGRQHSQTVINLDHHPTNTGFGDIHLVVPTAVSACEIVFDLLGYMGHDISEETAYVLLLGMVTDTLGFRVDSTTPRTLEIAQALMQKNAPLPEIMIKTLSSRSYEDVRLWKSSYPSVQLDNGLIYARVTQEDLKEAGLEKAGDGGLVSHLVNVNEAFVSVVFKELPNEQVEIGFRSKKGFNVGSLAFTLGGGGHTQASGCTVDGRLDEVIKRVIPMAHQVVADGISQID